MPASWHRIPRIQVIRMPIRIFPFTCLITRTAVISTPIKASRTVIPSELKLPPFRLPERENTATLVDSFSTTRCAF